MNRQPIALVLASFLALGMSHAKSEAIEFSCFGYSDFKVDGDRLFRNGQLDSRALNVSVTSNYISWRESPDALGFFGDFLIERDTGTMTIDEYSRDQSQPFRRARYTCTKRGEKGIGKI